MNRINKLASSYLSQTMFCMNKIIFSVIYRILFSINESSYHIGLHLHHVVTSQITDGKGHFNRSGIESSFLAVNSSFLLFSPRGITNRTANAKYLKSELPLSNNNEYIFQFVNRFHCYSFTIHDPIFGGPVFSMTPSSSVLSSTSVRISEMFNIEANSSCVMDGFSRSNSNRYS